MKQRFRVIDPSAGYSIFNAATTQECYDFLLTQDTSLNSYTVEDVEDEIEIDADEFMQAFRDGECPGDLQFF